MAHYTFQLTQIGRNEEWRCIVPWSTYSFFPLSWHWWEGERLYVISRWKYSMYAFLPHLWGTIERSPQKSPPPLSLTVFPRLVHGQLSDNIFGVCVSKKHWIVCPCVKYQTTVAIPQHSPVVKTYRFRPHFWLPCFDWWHQREWRYLRPGWRDNWLA